jgi:lysophospholipase L1-like esterase
MKIRILLAAAAALMWATVAPAFSQSKPTLYIIGDSTVKNHTPELEGWGDPIASYFDSSKIDVKNCALGGRSSRTFLTEGLWDKVVQDLKPGDFVLMQFGHNDGGSIKTSYRASLKGTGDETEDIVNPKTNLKETVHSYGWYMTKYVTDAKAKGALPIVLSPIPRNIWSPDNHVGRNTNDYGKWAADVAKAQSVPFVDLNGIIADKYDALGPDKVKAQFFPKDHTHTNPAGAELNASCVVEGLKGLKDDPLAPYLVQK